MGEREGFMRAIIAAPRDDTARLVFADWLEENDEEPLAHWVRKKVASPTDETILGPSDSVSAFGGIVARGVRAFAGKGVYPNGKLHYRRGFAESVECTAEMWLAHADELVWQAGQTVDCECAGWTRDTRREKGLGVSKCHLCHGTGSAPRPFPATAQPIERVTLTELRTLPDIEVVGATAHNDGYARFAGRHKTVGVGRNATGPDRNQTILDALLAAEWLGITFELPLLPPTAEAWYTAWQPVAAGAAVGYNPDSGLLQPIIGPTGD